MVSFPSSETEYGTSYQYYHGVQDMEQYVATNPAISDAAIALRVEFLQNMSIRNATRPAEACRPLADGCLCSRGCLTSWLGCRPSRFCHSNSTTMGAQPTSENEKPNVAILLFLTFSAKDVRNKFLSKPYYAYNRELRRIKWFLQTAQQANVSLPIHIVVAGDRNTTAESSLIQLGAQILVTELVKPPPWSSKFHKHSFNRISALSFTQFEKVIVMDNDIAVVANFDELAEAETPAVVWHSAAQFMVKLGEQCAVTGGLFVLRPSKLEYQRALAHLHGMYAGSRRFRYDGSDQEFFRSFYINPFELPIRYHATSFLKMAREEWSKVRVIHTISGFKNYDHRVPAYLRSRMKHFL